MTRVRWSVVVVVVAALVAATTACGSDPEPRTQEIVVPAGTYERLQRGEDVTIMPSVLRFRVGDTIRIRNDDVVDQSVGPYLVSAGAEFELTYGSPGRFEGFCPLSEGQHYEIVVTE